MNRIHHPEPAKAALHRTALAAYASPAVGRPNPALASTEKPSCKPHLLFKELRDHDSALKQSHSKPHGLAGKMKALQVADQTNPGELLAKHKGGKCSPE